MRSRTGDRPSFKSSSTLVRRQPSVVFKNVKNEEISRSNAINTASFGFDPEGTGLKSTQELPIDYTSFENHTFFNSARSKVDISFDSIINHFPYDSSRAEIQNFLNLMTGFEKFVFDAFPKNVGYLKFSGSSAPSDGTYIKVIDGKSFNFPVLNKVDYGLPVLDPGTSPFDIELFINIPELVNDNQIVTQRLSSNAGVTLALSSSSDTSKCNLIFLVSSASDAYILASGSVDKGDWVHISAQMQDDNGAKKATIYLDQTLFYTSSDTQDFGNLAFAGEPMYIGSGSSHTILDYSFTPQETLSCSMDEFRYFKNERSIQDLAEFSRQEVYPDEFLTLYLKFNEPSGSYTGNDYVLDSSGNKLHSRIYNFNSGLRNTGSAPTPMSYENINYSPILFAGHDSVVELNDSLLEDAESFDNDNPNFILKLVPRHYLAIGASAEGLTTYDQNLGDRYQASSVPGTGILPKPQLMVVFLLTYAKFFDELKLMIDYFSHVNYVELDDPESAIDKFLPLVAQYYGLELPDFFSNTTSDQFFYGKTLENNYGYAKTSLKQVRYQIWRRILGNITEIVQAKGTRSSIRSAILSTGIIPENFFNIREFGGPAVVSLKNLRQQTQEMSSLADMSGTLAGPGTSPDAQGLFTNIPTIISPFLSASRVEPGLPQIAGSIVDGLSDDPNDGLLTSGSFAIETTVKFKPTITHNNDQSLIRLQTTGSLSLSLASQPCLLNIVYNHNTSSGSGDLHLLVRSSDELTAPKLDLVIPDINMFNGEKWYVSAVRARGDLTQSLSSSYHLRCGYVEDQTTYTYFTTSSYFSETTTGITSHDLFQNLSASYNASGAFMIVGSQSLDIASPMFLNSNIETHFDGLTGQIRFWSKALTETESLEHLRNYASRGVEDPRFNFSFDTESTGTFERLHVDVSADQATTGSNGSGEIVLFDFSQNEFHMQGRGFEPTKKIVKNELFQINRISPNIDLLQTDDKVRVRSLFNLGQTDDVSYPAPVYQLGPEQAINDDNRFSVEFSTYKALNEDMIGLIGDTQFLDDALGQTSSIFDEIYPDLEKVSKVYFERLTDPVDVRRCLELFKWFDASLTVLIEQLLPRKTKFLGVNFVIESHLLERNRYRYPVDRMYLLNERPQRSTDLFLTALTAKIRRM